MARILIIDDDQLLCDTVRTMVASGGHEAVVAADPDIGLQLFRDQRFDLVICDLFMPTKEAGLATLAALRTVSASTPILSMTGSVPTGPGGQPVDADVRQATGQLGRISAIGKPFRARELLEAVRRCLGSIAAGTMLHHALWI